MGLRIGMDEGFGEEAEIERERISMSRGLRNVGERRHGRGRRRILQR